MREDEQRLYKEAFGQVPTRTGKIKVEVMKRYDGKPSRFNRRTLRFAVPIVLLLVITMLTVVILPKTDSVPLMVYAANGEYVELGKEAVNLKVQYEPYLVNSQQDEQYSCVFLFDIVCESKDVRSITYKIVGEKTAMDVSEFSQNDVWFAEVTNKKADKSNKKYPFDYRYMETKDEKETYTYLGTELIVDGNEQNQRNYYIECKMDQGEPFYIHVSVEKLEGTNVEKELKLKPALKEMGELWVNLKY